MLVAHKIDSKIHSNYFSIGIGRREVIKLMCLPQDEFNRSPIMDWID